MDWISMRRRVARTRLAPAVALPVRAASVAGYDAQLLARSARWLARSREHTNYTYDLTDRNLGHLAWWVSVVTDTPVAEARAHIAEAREDGDLREHVREATLRSSRRGLADPTARLGRRLGWYAIARAVKPDRIVETGTDKGLGSVLLASALLRNGRGRLTTVDVNPDSGYLIAGRYAEVVDRVVGDSVAVLGSSAEPVDVFLHDSLHTWEYETAELAAVDPRLSRRAVVLSDNSHVTDALSAWAEKTGRQFLFFREEPADHWYPGDGIGAASWPRNDPPSR
ncbi:class I SAM-dependent methyltransferase [Geodermatophilus sp. TF02-6]|uniref:class I SAM-dependent methyltransferase n=1 Tax=Geodermatophilus sp. TF02-6 TaxID=2250575 RepID=UPI000DEA93AD|nr:class I SAM-dependent methyltransferase [Geodermatophilus sp. TF02-6]RBY75310.1 class I SAM-dependent methyltransferase [Geodermatophilus sp. TF02-6]